MEKSTHNNKNVSQVCKTDKNKSAVELQATLIFGEINKETLDKMQEVKKQEKLYICGTHAMVNYII